MSVNPHCHIGKVTFKQNGKSVHRMRPRDDNGVVRHMRAATGHMLGTTPQPHAYFLVTLWYDPEAPGYPVYEATWATEHDALPVELMAQQAAAILQSEMQTYRTTNEVMSTLGYDREPWHPDDEPA